MTRFFDPPTGGFLTTPPEFNETVQESLPNTKAGFFTNFASRVEENLLNNLSSKVLETGIGILDSSRVISPEFAKENYGVTINEPLTENVVAYQSVVNQRRLEHARIMEVIDAGSFLGIDDPLAALTSSVIDPVNVALYLGLSLASPAIAAGALGGTAATLFSKIPVPTSILGKVALGGATEAIETTAVEIPISLVHANQFGQEFTVEDALKEIGIGTAAGGLFGGIGGVLGSAKSKLFREKIIGKSPDEVLAENNIGKDQTSSNRIPDIKLIEDFTAKNNSNNTSSISGGGYVYTPIRPAEVKDSTFFAAFKSNKEIRLDNNIPLGRSFGDGLILTDNKDFAKNFSAKTIDLSSGRVVEVDLTDPLLYDLSQPLDPNLRLDIERNLGNQIDSPDLKVELEKALVPFLDKDELDILDAKTTKDFLDQVEGVAFANGSSEIQEAVNQVFKDAGFTGYLFENNSNGSRSNSVFLFDPEDARIVDITEVPNSRVHGVGQDPTDAQKLAVTKLLDHQTDPTKAIDYLVEFEDIRAEPLVLEFEDGPPPIPKEAFDKLDLDSVELDSNTPKQVRDNINKLKKINKNSITPEQAPEIGKALFFCNNLGDD